MKVRMSEKLYQYLVSKEISALTIDFLHTKTC